MNDVHAAKLQRAAAGDEADNLAACGGSRHAMQVERCAAGELAAAQALQLALPHPGPCEIQLFLRCHGAGIEAIGEAVRQCLRLAPVALPWPGRQRLAEGCGPVMVNFPHRSDAAAEQLDILRGGFFFTGHDKR